MTTLVTGSAGFIGFHVCKALLARGERVFGMDNLNDYYDVRLKEDRLALLRAHEAFDFVHVDIADRAAMAAAVERERHSITGIVHLAAQAGVRHSLIDPYTYVQANVMGQVVVPHQAFSRYTAQAALTGKSRCNSRSDAGNGESSRFKTSISTLTPLPAV